MNDLERKILEAFTEFSTPLDEDDLDSSNIEGIVQHSKHRISTDLTDILWDILKCNYRIILRVHLFNLIQFFFVNKVVHRIKT